MESIGKYLKKARQKKNISLQDVASQTRIHHSVLENLEAGNFENLPSPMYVKGFLKRYAEYLGLKSAPLIDRYLETHPKNSKQDLVLPCEKISKSSLTKFAGWGIAGAGLVIIFLAVFFIIKLLFFHRPAADLIAPVKITTTRMRESSKTPVPPAALAQKKNISKKAVIFNTSEPLTLQAVAEDDLWLEVISDNKLLFQGILPKGSRETWKAGSRFRLQIGNAGALELTLNDKLLGMLGENGQILKEVILTKQAVEISPETR
ncbi:MAG: DUF4115 domain-containing protein [Candidatus Omnitrophota bacterium]|nr:DUF4115 domain-containing protein [Candidatus Omnitrophota bacterium]